MSSKVPTVREIAWISVVPQLIVLGLLILIFYQINIEQYILYGALTYFIISQLLRRLIASEHRKGMRQVKSEDFEKAIAHFQNSYDYFKRNEWIDKNRYLTLLSSGKMSYREMALNNIAFCYGQLGNGKLSKEYYSKTLDEFPESGIAKAALKMLKAASKTID